MPLLDLSAPLGQTASVTRLLRNRKEPLLEQLSQARAVLNNENNIYFPRKEEWLLEWLAERMKEDDGHDGKESQACLSASSWHVLCDLLQSTSCAPTTAAAILRKHGFLQLLSNTLRNAVSRYSTEKSNLVTGMHIDVQQAPSEGSSSHTETGSPIETHFKRTDGRSRKYLQQGQNDDPRDLLMAITRVVAAIQNANTNGESSPEAQNLKRKIEKSTPVLKGTPENGAEILGSFLTLSTVPRHGSIQDDLEMEEALFAFVSVWKSCIYGNANSKKISILVSKHILLPSISFLSIHSSRSKIQTIVGALIFTYIFQPTNNAKEGSDSLKSLLSPLDALKAGDMTTNASEAGTALLRLALDHSSVQVVGQKQRKLSDDACSMIFKDLLHYCVKTQDLEGTLSSMLDVVIQSKHALNKEAMDAAMYLCMNQNSGIDYGVLRRLAELNTDALLAYDNGKILDLLADSQSIMIEGEETWKLMDNLVAGYVKARNLTSFLERWRKELGSKPWQRKDIWNHDLLQTIVASFIEKALNLSQIEQLVNQMSTAVSYPETVVMDCIIRGIVRIDTLDKLRSNEDILAFVKAMHEDLANNSTTSEWKEWQVLLRVSETWGSDMVKDYYPVLKVKAKQLVKGILEQEEMLEHNHILTMFFALQYLLNIEAGISSVAENDNMSAVQYIPLILERLQKHQEEVTWNGDLSSMSTLTSSVVALFVVLITKWNRMLGCTPSGLLLQIMQQFFKFASESSTGVLGRNITMRDAWLDLLSRPTTFESMELVDLLVTILKNALAAYVLSEKSIASSDLHIIIRSLSQIPLEALRRSHRESLLDDLLKIIQKPKQCSETQLLDVFSLASVLMEVPNNTAVIGSVVDGIHGYDLIFSDFILITTDILKAKRRLGKQVLRHILANKDQNKANASLLIILQSSQETFDSLIIKQYENHNMNSLAQIATTIEEYWSLTEDAGFESMRFQLSVLRLNLITYLQEWALQWRSGKDLSWRLDFVLDVLREVLALDLNSIGGNEDIQSTIQKLVKQNGVLYNNGHDVSSPHIRVAEIQCLLSSDKQSIFAALALGIVLLEEDVHTKSMISAIDSMFQRLDVQTYDDILRDIADACLPPSSSAQQSYYQLLRTCLYSGPKLDATDREQLANMSFVYNQACLGLCSVSNLETFMLLIDCISISLDKKGWIVDQINVDSTFASINATASVGGPLFDAPNLDLVYIPLCKIVGSILRTHRRRLSGRHHLIIDTLQTLLRCLFIPRIQGRKKSDRSIHPPWIENAYKRNESMLSVKSAIAFNRLLTTLCDPPSLSVTTNRKTTELSSSTVAARATISKHVPYIVLEFIQLSLTHRVIPGIRNALSPGLYAMFDVMGPEVLRMVNATLDVQGRVLFRALYDEWGKLGKWSE